MTGDTKLVWEWRPLAIYGSFAFSLLLSAFLIFGFQYDDFPHEGHNFGRGDDSVSNSSTKWIDAGFVFGIVITAIEAILAFCLILVGCLELFQTSTWDNFDRGDIGIMIGLHVIILSPNAIAQGVGILCNYLVFGRSLFNIASFGSGCIIICCVAVAVMTVIVFCAVLYGIWKCLQELFSKCCSFKKVPVDSGATSDPIYIV